MQRVAPDEDQQLEDVVQSCGSVRFEKEEKNADEFSEQERNYYYDQLSLSRRWALSTEVDTEHEEARAAQEMENQQNEGIVQNELEFIMGEDGEYSNAKTLNNTQLNECTDPNHNFAVNRSGNVRFSVSRVDSSTQR